jgi:hypothetical protein
VAERRLDTLHDAELAAALAGLGESVAWPPARTAGAPDLATRVRARIVADDPRARTRRSWLPLRRSLVLAIVALAVLAAVAAAVAFGVPGIRLVFGEPPVTPPPSVVPASPAPGSPSSSALPGANLDLGDVVALDALDDRVGFPVRLPTDPAVVGSPTAFVNRSGIVSVVWPNSDDLPATTDSSVGLLLTEFRGTVDDAVITKIIDSGTRVAPVAVGAFQGYWISGAPHFYRYTTPDGVEVEESRRWVGDALIWYDGELTYRIETSLGREAAIRIAESLD